MLTLNITCVSVQAPDLPTLQSKPKRNYDTRWCYLVFDLIGDLHSCELNAYVQARIADTNTC